MSAPSVHEQPHTTLRRWSIIRISTVDFDLSPGMPSFHFVGQRADAPASGTLGFQRSSPIREIDLSSMTARTASGRVYALLGDPAGPNDKVAWDAVEHAVTMLRVDPDDVSRLSPHELAMSLAGVGVQNGWRM